MTETNSTISQGNETSTVTQAKPHKSRRLRKKNNLKILSPEERAIMEVAFKISQEKDAQLLKKQTIETPKSMGWSKEETELFHAFLKQFALEKESEALRTEQRDLSRGIIFVKQAAKVSRHWGLVTGIAAAGIAGITFGFLIEKEPQNINTPQQTNVIRKTLASAGVASSVIGGSGALFMLSLSLVCSINGNRMKQQQTESNEQKKRIIEAKKENAIVQLHWRRAIRQNRKS